MKKKTCKTCNGTGRVFNKASESWGDHRKGIKNNQSGTTCKKCHGTGMK